MIILWNEVKGKVCPRAGRDGPEGESQYSSTLSLTSALDRGGWLTHRFYVILSLVNMLILP